MALNFPGSPNDNDRHTENGIEYYYDASVGAWLLVVPALTANTLNTQIVFNNAGSSNGSNGLLFDVQANNFITNNVSVTNNVSAQYYHGDGSYLTNIPTTIAEASFDQANVVWDSANSNYTYAANNVMLAANSAFAMANAANLMPVGNTISSNGYYTNRATRRSINFIEGTNVTINVDDDPTLNTANVTITATDTGITAVEVANTIQDNGYSVIRATRDQINFLEDESIKVTIEDDAAGDRANVTITSPAAAAAYGLANSNYTYAANNVMLAANSAFAMANAANLMPVGNTISSNGYYTNRATRRGINFLEGDGITINVDDDPTLNTANVTITGHDTTIAVSAFDQANTVWDSANSNYTYAANNVMIAANSAFAMANAANLMPVGNTIAANGYYTNRATRRGLNFIEGSNITINVDDDPTINVSNITITGTHDTTIAEAAFDQANVVWDSANSNYTYAANDVMIAANSAFAMANAANLMPVGNTISSNSYYTNRATRRGINFIEGTNVTINVDDDPTLNTANVTITATDTGITAIEVANTIQDNGYSTIRATRDQINFLEDESIKVTIEDDAAGDRANVTITSPAAAAAYAKANAANITADTADTQSIAAFDQANTVWNSANSNYTYAANNVMLVANSAYDKANSANITADAALPKTGGTITGDLTVDGNVVVSGNTTYANTETLLIGDNIIELNSDLLHTVPPSEDAGIVVNRGSAAANVSILWNEADDVWTFTNDETTFYAIPTNNAVESAQTDATAAFVKANAVYDASNSNYTYAANDVMIAANSAFAMANAANLMPVGNTIVANGYYTNRATRRGINFLEGSNITINVDDDPTLNTANVTITGTHDTTIAEAAFDQANVVWDSANSNYTYAANNVMLAANSAFAMANAANLMPVGNTISSNGYYTNRATRRAINFIEGTNVTINVDDDPTLNTANVTITGVHDTTIAEASFDQANTVWDSANNNYTYAANNVMIAANSAFAMANAANLMPVGNTITSNSYYTNRATRRAINFIEGTNVTINVDDDPTLNTANVTITGTHDTTIAEAAFDQANTVWDSANNNYTYAANNVMLAANSAFAMANAANLIPVGNTISSNSYYTNRATRRGINFIEGSGITINVDDDPTINVSNITITGAAGDTTIAEAAFDQANTVWDSANSNYTYAANDVMRKANVTSFGFETANAAGVISIGRKGSVEIPFNCTIDQWTLLADQTGISYIDLWVAPYSQYPTTAANTITNNTYIGITSAGDAANQGSGSDKITSATINAGDIVTMNVVNAVSAQRISLSVKVIKT